MKLSITIELDKDSSQLLKTSFVNFSKQINDLIGIFGKENCSVEEVAVPEPEPGLAPNVAKLQQQKRKPKHENQTK
ncbi:MAG: hypothetical protein U5K27_02530 [Desulfotignum sp.]|nr:hypothetical protein [Desulfotignum sp.]